MAPVTTFTLGVLLEKEKLNSSGNNFTDWYRNVRIVLRSAKKDYVLLQTLGELPENATDDQIRIYQSKSDDSIAVQCAMLASMEPDLQKRFENWGAYEIIQELKALFHKQARYEISKALFECKMAEDSSVSQHVLRLSGYIQGLAELDFPISQELGTDLVFTSHPPSYGSSIMSGMERSMGELFTMLKTAESGIQKDANHVMMVNKTTNFEKMGKSKDDSVTDMPRKSKTDATSDVECFFCKEKGHWKRNCKKYLAEKKKSGKSSSGMSVIHVIDVFLAGPQCSSWVLDTGSVAHVRNSMQELQRPKRLAKDEVMIRVGNRAKVAMLAVGVLPLQDLF